MFALKKPLASKVFYMKMENKIFLILLAATAIIVAGVITENTRSVINPKKVEIKVDTSHIKSELENAGLTPREAMYWKEL